MKRPGPIISRDLLDAAPAVVAFLMLALASMTFAYDRLFDDLMGFVPLATPGSSAYIFIAIAVAIFPLALLRIWTGPRLKAIMYLAWVLYLPSVVYVSGIDPLKMLSVTMNFSIFSSKLPSDLIAIAGIALASGSLVNRSFIYIQNARENLLGRGADKNEVSRALYRNALFEIKIILASAAVVLLIMAGAPVVGQGLSGVLRSSGFGYLLTGLGAVVILALIFLVYLWPHKKGEKG